MRLVRSFLAASAALAALGLAAAPAVANSPTAKTTNAPCFFINQWQGWRAPNANTIYLRVNLNQIYRADLSAGSQELTWPGAYHLISRVQGSNSICGPLDLQLSVADSHGFRQPLIVKSLTLLTPEEVAALPKKDLP